MVQQLTSLETESTFGMHAQYLETLIRSSN